MSVSVPHPVLPHRRMGIASWAILSASYILHSDKGAVDIILTRSVSEGFLAPRYRFGL